MRAVHVQALVLWVTYTLLAKVLLGTQIKLANPVYAYLISAVFGLVFSLVFLFLFSHEKFFKFAHEIEQKGKRQEKKWLRKFKHYGKVATTLAIAFFGSPLYIALTVRLLWPKSKYRYVITPLLTIIGGWIWLTITRNSVRSVWDIVVRSF